MFSKLIVVILVVGAVACILLTTRQQRLQSVHDLAEIQKRVAEHDRTLWSLRLAIAQQLVPSRIEHMARGMGELEPLPIASLKARQPHHEATSDPRPMLASAAPVKQGAGARPVPGKRPETPGKSDRRQAAHTGGGR